MLLSVKGVGQTLTSSAVANTICSGDNLNIRMTYNQKIYFFLEYNLNDGSGWVVYNTLPYNSPISNPSIRDINGISLPTIISASSIDFRIRYSVGGSSYNAGAATTSGILLTITDNPLPNAFVAADNTICNTTSINIGSASISGSTYSWSSSLGSYSSTISNPLVSPNTTQTYTLTETITSTGCTNSNQIVITVNPLPIVSATVTPSSGTICIGSNATLTGVGASTYTYTGRVTNATPFAPSTTTTYTVTGTDANGCVNTNTKTITVNPLPTVTATVTPISGEVCLGSNATLTGVGASTYTFTGGVANATAFAPTTTTTYTVTGTDANGCVNTNTKTITVNALPIVSATVIPVSGEVCLGSNATLTGVGASTYTYTGGVINATAFAPTTTITYTVTGTDAKGCVNTSTKTIKVNSSPAPPTVTDKEYCFNETAIPLTATNLANHNLGWYGTNATGGTSVSTAPTPLTSIVGSSTYYVSQTNTANSCESPRAAINVKVKALPTTPTITSNSPVCEGASLNLNTPNISGAIYYWEGSNGFISSSVNPSINNAMSTNAGNYTLKIKLNGCISSVSAPLVVAVNPLPSKPTLTSNSPIEVGATINLKATSLSGTTYNWSGPNGFSSTQQNPSISPAAIIMSGDYFATVSLNGCVSNFSDPLTVTVNATPASYFQIPNAFVPGSSNEFDNKFRVFSNSGFPSNLFVSLSIYNRSGKFLKKLESITESWDGRIEGVLQEADVYLWTAIFIDDPLTKKIPRSGTFILLK